jgi:hypothetical protein
MQTISRDEVPGLIKKLRQDDPDWRYVAVRQYNPSRCAHPHGPCKCQYAILIEDEERNILGYL